MCTQCVTYTHDSCKKLKTNTISVHYLFVEVSQHQVGNVQKVCSSVSPLDWNSVFLNIELLTLHNLSLEPWL